SSSLIEKEIQVSPSPVKPFIVGSSVVCENDQHVAFKVSPDNYPSSSYNWEVRRASDNSIGGGYIVEGQSTSNVLVNFLEEDVILTVRESTSVCVSPVASKTITLSNPVKASLTITNEITCF